MGRLQTLWAGLVLVFSAMSAFAAEVAGEMSLGDRGGEVVLSVPLTGPVPWSVWLASDPPRLVVELSDVRFADEVALGTPSVSTVTAERHGPGKSRLIAVLREPLAVEAAEMVGTEEGQAELRVVLAPTTGAAFHKMAKPLEQARIPAKGASTVVVIDPGHGGRDPGADAGAVSEAVLMLEMAMLLKADLEATGQFDVVLTRSGDDFVPLEARLTRARAAAADVFLSLHADRLAEDAGHASGVTVYTLAEHLAEDAADRQTARHGDTDVLKGVDLEGAGDGVALALIALQRRETEPRTAALSGTLIRAFQAAGLAVNARPERQGDFAVLKAADIPSVLIELGFLSSEADLARLTSKPWRIEASLAMRDALLQWKQEDRVRRDVLGK